MIVWPGLACFGWPEGRSAMGYRSGRAFIEVGKIDHRNVYIGYDRGMLDQINENRALLCPLSDDFEHPGLVVSGGSGSVDEVYFAV